MVTISLTSKEFGASKQVYSRLFSIQNKTSEIFLIFPSKIVLSDESSCESDQDEPPTKLREVLAVPGQEMKIYESKHLPEDMTHS